LEGGKLPSTDGRYDILVIYNNTYAFGSNFSMLRSYFSDKQSNYVNVYIITNDSMNDSTGNTIYKFNKSLNGTFSTFYNISVKDYDKYIITPTTSNNKSLKDILTDELKKNKNNKIFIARISLQNNLREQPYIYYNDIKYITLDNNNLVEIVETKKTKKT
jgi:hypothetical protein